MEELVKTADKVIKEHAATVFLEIHHLKMLMALI